MDNQRGFVRFVRLSSDQKNSEACCADHFTELMGEVLK